MGEAAEEQGGWTYKHDEGSDLRQLFGLLLHEQIFDEAVPDAFFAPSQGAPLDLHAPDFYARRKEGIDARLESRRESPRLAESRRD